MYVDWTTSSVLDTLDSHHTYYQPTASEYNNNDWLQLTRRHIMWAQQFLWA